jgi:hypothetical protein
MIKSKIAKNLPGIYKYRKLSPFGEFKILVEGKERGGEKARCTCGTTSNFSPTSNAAIGTLISERHSDQGWGFAGGSYYCSKL